MWEYIRLNYRIMIAFRLSFITGIFQRIISSSQFILFWLILYNFQFNNNIGSWSFNEIIFLIAFFELNFGLFMLFAVGFFSLPYLVPSGKLDDLLILPMNTSKALIGDNLSPERFIRIIAALILLVFAISVNSIISPLLILFGLIVAIIGSILENIFFMSLNLLTFWLGNMGAIVESLTELDDAKRFPLDKSSKVTKYLLTYIIPVMFVSSFPASVITEKISMNEILVGLATLVVLIFIWITLFKSLWRYGLRNYQSGGSL